jgi:hypothetical protein
MTQFFSDGFESGDFSAWNSTSSGGGAARPEVTTNRPHYGTYNMQYTITNGYYSKATKTITASNTLYARVYFSLDTLPASGKQCTLIAFSGSGSIAKIYATNNAGNTVWKLSLRENGVYQNYLAATGPNANAYYCVELYIKIDSAAGEATLYVNDCAVASTSGKKTDNNGNITAVDVGEYDGYGGANTITVSVDDVKVADACIGPEDAAQSVADSVALTSSLLFNKLCFVNETSLLIESCMLQKNLKIDENVFLVETLEAGQVRRTKLFLVLGDLAIQLTKD